MADGKNMGELGKKYEDLFPSGAPSEKPHQTAKGNYADAKKVHTQDRPPTAKDVPAIQKSKKIYT